MSDNVGESYNEKILKSIIDGEPYVNENPYPSRIEQLLIELKTVIEQGGGVIIDTQVNGESTNPVENRAIYTFVNSSVATNTANFKGTYNSLAELQAVTDATNNDYAFVMGTDAAGNTYFDRYKYNGSEWAFEYELNNSSFTATQWATIQSGLTAADKTKLSGIEAGAEVNVQSDWNQTDTEADDFIKNKPTIPAAQVNSDWSAASGVAQILNKPTLGTAASKGVDSTPTASSTNLVESGGVEAALAEKADKSIVGLKLVASNTMGSSTAFTYAMNKNDFIESSPDLSRSVGTYIISIMPWSTSPTYSLYAVSYTGGAFNYTAITKIAGADMSVTVENGVISVSGLPSTGGKISIHALL